MNKNKNIDEILNKNIDEITYEELIAIVNSI